MQESSALFRQIEESIRDGTTDATAERVLRFWQVRQAKR
jgi:hypothetical protein